MNSNSDQNQRAIYVVEMCAPSFPRPIKIGSTSSTQQKEINGRLCGLLTASPYPLRLIGAWNRNEADPTECQLHNLYSQYRINGEWFLLPPQAEQGLLTRSEPHSMIGKVWFTESFAQFRFHSVADQVRLDWQALMTEMKPPAVAEQPPVRTAEPIAPRSECWIDETKMYTAEDLVPNRHQCYCRRRGGTVLLLPPRPSQAVRFTARDVQ